MNKAYQKEILEFIDELKEKGVTANVSAQVAGQLYAEEMKQFYSGKVDHA
jgi:hypothetical protein